MIEESVLWQFSYTSQVKQKGKAKVGDGSATTEVSAPKRAMPTLPSNRNRTVKLNFTVQLSSENYDKTIEKQKKIVPRNSRSESHYNTAEKSNG